MFIDFFLKILVFIIITYSMGSDIYTYKVKNYVFVFGWIISFLLSIYLYGVTGVCTWAMRVVFIIIVLLPVYVIKAIAGADVKAFSVIGSFVGINVGLTIIVISFLLAFLLSIFKLISIIRVNYSKQNLRNYFGSFINQKHRMHFMIPIWMATVMVFIVI